MKNVKLLSIIHFLTLNLKLLKRYLMRNMNMHLDFEYLHYISN